MLYVKYVGLATLYSSVLALLLVIIDVIAYPALLQGQIQKKLPFSMILKDLYMEFTANEKPGKFHAWAHKFLNSMASVGYQLAMCIYMIVVIIGYSLLGLFIFNIICYFFAALFAVLNIGVVSNFFDCFNIIYEIYGPVIIAFAIFDVISHHYHKYINERFELKKSGIGDTFHNIIRIIVFIIPGIVGVIAVMMQSAFTDVMYFVAHLVNFVNLKTIFFGFYPDVFSKLTNGELFVLCSISSLVLLMLYDISYTKRLSSKANKKILKETQAEMKLKEETLKDQEEELANTKNELEKAKAEKEIEEPKEETPKATFIDVDEGDDVTSAHKLGELVGTIKNVVSDDSEAKEDESVAYGIGSIVGNVKEAFKEGMNEEESNSESVNEEETINKG